MTNMSVLELPPRENCNRYVSWETGQQLSRLGIKHGSLAGMLRHQEIDSPCCFDKEHALLLSLDLALQ